MSLTGVLPRLRVETIPGSATRPWTAAGGSAVRDLLNSVYRWIVRRDLRALARAWQAGDQDLLGRLGEKQRRTYALFDGGMANVVHPDLAAADLTPGAARTHWIGAETPSGGVLLYVPGGSFVSRRSPRVTAFICRLARASGLRVMVADYRLAPEHPYPAAPEDVVAAFDRLLAEGHAPGDIVVAAESAGAAVALSALFRLRDRGVTPAAIVLFSPWVDLALTGWSMVTRGLTADSPFVMEMLALCSRFYLGRLTPVDPMASPLWGKFEGLPPLLIHTSRLDVLHDDATRLAERAAGAGVDTTLRIWPRGAHVFERYDGPETDRSVLEASRFLRERLGLSEAA